MLESLDATDGVTVPMHRMVLVAGKHGRMLMMFSRLNNRPGKHHKFVTHGSILVSFSIVLSSCQIPNLRQAETGPETPSSFTGSSSSSGESSAQLHVDQFFNDPMLIRLMNEALTNNQELKILAEEIEITNNDIDVRRGAYLPFVNMKAGAGFERSSAFTPLGTAERELQYQPGRNYPDPLPDFLLAANVSWEVDIWRKLRNARDAATLRYLATSEGRNYVVTRLVAEVAEKYYDLMALDNKLKTLEQTIELQKESLRIAKAKKEAGRDTELAVQRFQAEVNKNQSETLMVKQEIIEVENRINFLAGRFPQPVERASAGFLDLKIQAVNTGIPSQLLQNRPDIRQAQRQLEAAGLDIEIAKAEFYPSLDIIGGIGFRAFNPKYFFNPDALIANTAGELTSPLINKLAIQAEYRNANARQLQSVYNYQRIILDAFTEVINRVSMADNYGKSIEIRKQQLTALEASVNTATNLFQNARAEYSEVLFAQRDLLEARMVLIETKRKQLSAMVNTYQALGGGVVQSSTNPQ